MLSPSDTAIVFLLALLLFGPEQLPKLARQLGEAMRHIQSTTHTFMQEMERAADSSDEREHQTSDSMQLQGAPPGESDFPPEAKPTTYQGAESESAARAPTDGAEDRA